MYTTTNNHDVVTVFALIMFQHTMRTNFVYNQLLATQRMLRIKSHGTYDKSTKFSHGLCAYHSLEGDQKHEK